MVLSGNRDSREITGNLSARGFSVIAATVTDYGKKLALESGATEAVTGVSSYDELRSILKDKQITAVVDAGHPYPTSIQDTVFNLCSELGLLYIRYLREETNLPDSQLIYKVPNWEQAAAQAALLGQIVFVTTGTFNLEVLVKGLEGKRVVVRVLPEPQIIEKCLQLGLTPKDIIAMQGPFSKAFNKATFKAVKAQVVISKDGGKTGGTETKISAALELGIPVVLITRPVVERPNTVRTYQRVEELLLKNNSGVPR